MKTTIEHLPKKIIDSQLKKPKLISYSGQHRLHKNNMLKT